MLGLALRMVYESLYTITAHVSWLLGVWIIGDGC